MTYHTNRGELATNSINGNDALSSESSLFEFFDVNLNGARESVTAVAMILVATVGILAF